MAMMLPVVAFLLTLSSELQVIRVTGLAWAAHQGTAAPLMPLPASNCALASHPAAPLPRPLPWKTSSNS